MLILQRKAGESLVIGEDITVRVMSVDGVRVRLAITAPEDVSILRSELVTAATANRDAAMEESAPDALLALLGDVLEKQEEPTELTHSPATPDGKEDRPMMNSIASMAMDMSAASFATEYSLAVTKKMMDTQELAGQELVNMLPDLAAMAPPKGDFIDVYA